MVSRDNSLRIVYFGTPAFAVPTLEAIVASRHPVVAVVSQPDRPKGRGQHLSPTPTKMAAAAHGIPVLQPARLKDDQFLAGLRSLAPDLGVVAAYGRIIPDALLALPRLGMINVHASLLPAYRGAAPVHRAVLAGDAETGVTIMRVVAELDAGPMLDAVRIPIRPDDTSVQVEQALAVLGATRLVAVLDQIAAGTAIGVPQQDDLASYAPKITRDEGRIDWSLPAREIHNRVRGLQPWPLVSTRIDGQRYLLHRTSVSDAETDAAPGTILSAAGDRIAVATGAGVLDVLAIQPEGRRVMSVREFLAGRRIAAGTVAAPA